MNLIDLNNQIHNADKAEFISQRASWVSSITSELASASEADIEYFRNHTGRELIRKANLFGDTAFIKDDFDDGFRPKRVDPTTGLNGNIISWYDAADSNSYELDGKLIDSVKDKSGSYNLSSVTPEERPTINTLTFPDGRSRNTFYFPPAIEGGVYGPNNSGTTLRSYDFTHNFSSDGELNIAMVVNFVPSGPTDPQDFVFEFANDAKWPKPTMPRGFLRKGGEGSTPNFGANGLGAGLTVTSSKTGYELYNPISILFNLHLSNGSQISRYNGVEVNSSAESTISNIQYAKLDGNGNRGGGIWYGSNWQGNSQLEGGLGEIILYDDFAEDGEFLESYLAKKWGFDVPTPKHFKTFV